MPRQDAHQPLLDAAERLFAQHGIHGISDRQVAEAAGNTNHSAVRYYFGGREGLLLALVRRAHEGLDATRLERLAASDSLLGDVRALVLPLTEAYAALPVPSWRARFMEQILHDPVSIEMLPHRGDLVAASKEVWASVKSRLPDTDPMILRRRAQLMTHVVGAACAEIEARAEASGDPGPWAAAGGFLSDAITGMLMGPVTPVGPIVPAD